jgi:hypothetical protein
LNTSTPSWSAIADRHLHAVQELLLASRPRHQTAVTGRHVTSCEVQPDQLHPGVADGGDELVDLLIGGGRGREGPPELDGVKAGSSGGPWPAYGGTRTSTLRTGTARRAGAPGVGWSA